SHSVFGSLRRASSTPNPSSFGRRMSRKTMSGRSLRAISKAFWPSDATSTSYPYSSSLSLYIWATDGSSSTNSTRTRSRPGRDSSATRIPKLSVRRSRNRPHVTPQWRSRERPGTPSSAPSGNRRCPRRDLPYLSPPLLALRGYLGDHGHPRRGPDRLRLWPAGQLPPAGQHESDSGRRRPGDSALGLPDWLPVPFVADAFHLRDGDLRCLRFGFGPPRDHLGSAARCRPAVLRDPRLFRAHRIDGTVFLLVSTVDMDRGGLVGGAACDVHREGGTGRRDGSQLASGPGSMVADLPDHLPGWIALHRRPGLTSRVSRETRSARRALTSLALAMGLCWPLTATAEPLPPSYRQAVVDTIAIVSSAEPGDVAAAQKALAALDAGTSGSQPEIEQDLRTRPPDFADAKVRLHALLDALSSPASTADPAQAGQQLHQVLTMKRYDPLHQPPSLLDRVSQWIQDRLNDLLRLLFGGGARRGSQIPEVYFYLIGAALIGAAAVIIFRSTSGHLS